MKTSYRPAEAPLFRWDTFRCQPCSKGSVSTTVLQLKETVKSELYRVGTVFRIPSKRRKKNDESSVPDPDFLFRIRIQSFRLNTNSDPDPGFWWLKILTNLQLENFLNIFFCTKIAIYLFLGLHKEHPRTYRRSLQPSKENFIKV
jgi:hypothetical protein